MPRAKSQSKAKKSTKGNGGFRIEFKNTAQELAWATFQQHDVLFLIGPAGTGKAQPLDATVFTPSGKRTMGEISVGDDVLTPTGTANVVAEHPQGKIDIYRVNFSDGDSVECCSDHLWEVDNSNNGWSNSRVVSTQWIMENCHNQGRQNLEVRLAEADFEERDIAIDPYLLGVMIGDGGKRSEYKFVPEDYLFNNKKVRLEILRGLMDTNGSVDERGYVEFSSSSKKLAEDVKFLVQSLGGLCKIIERDTDCLPSYRCHIKFLDSSSLFRLSREKNRCNKRNKLVRRIKNVDFVGNKEAKCVSLNTSDGLYLTNNFVVTHNSFLACAFACQQLLNKDKRKIVLTRPIVESGESLGFLPGEFEEKVHPYMLPMYDCMDKLVGVDSEQRERVNNNMEVAPIAYMRGRSQPLDAKILTPNGYRNMGLIKKGDYVIGSDGDPVKVLKVYPQGNLDVYKVTFTDGVSVECSADHLWDTTTLYERRRRKEASTKTTSDIAKSIKYSHAYNHQVPMVKPVCFEEKDLPIDPYVLGALIGCLHETASVTLTSVDEQIADEVDKRLPCDLTLKLASDDEKTPQYRVVTECSRNSLKRDLRNFELLGKLSCQKFIPEDYKLSSISQRLELLRGLMDTDGCCFEQKGKRKPRVQYYTTSEVLAHDTACLVHSLGGTAKVRERKLSKEEFHLLNGRPVSHSRRNVWVVGIRMLENPFNLPRKADRFVPINPLRAITSIEKVDRKECQCIRVDAEDSLYVTDHCVVTHNTFDDAVCIFDEAQNATLMQLKLFLTRFGEGSKIIITGDPTQSDIGGEVALTNVMNRIKDVPGVGVIQFKSQQIVRHPLVSSIIEKLED